MLRRNHILISLDKSSIRHRRNINREWREIRMCHCTTFRLKRDDQIGAAGYVYTLGAAHFTHFAYLTAPFYWQSCQYPTPTGGHPPAAAPRRAPSIHTILHDRGPFLQSCKVYYPTPSRGHTQHFGTPDCQNTTYAIIMGYGYVSTPRAWTPTTHRVQ